MVRLRRWLPSPAQRSLQPASKTRPSVSSARCGMWTGSFVRGEPEFPMRAAGCSQRHRPRQKLRWVVPQIRAHELDDTLAVSGRTGQHWHDTELHRNHCGSSVFRRSPRGALHCRSTTLKRSILHREVASARYVTASRLLAQDRSILLQADERRPVEAPEVRHR